MTPQKFLITTPIYYINDRPHIGHTYTTVAADILARWHRLRGDEVFFLSGTDENSQKTVQAAEKQGKPLDRYTDEMAAVWEETWKSLGLTIDHFIRTTSAVHRQGTQKFWEEVSNRQIDGKPNIYKGKYVGLYCEGCEAYVKESDLVDGLCQYHRKPPIRLEEENYFFALDAYRARLLARLAERPRFVQPQARFNEVQNYIDQHLDPLSVSRATRAWGIPVPGDTSQVMYVWFDALLNYLTGVGYGDVTRDYRAWWNPDTRIVHLVGKDIIKFHCAIWPAMLMAAEEHLPDEVVAHGFFTIDGDKISKSLGNAIDPLELKAKYGFDAVRYFIFREIPFGEDGDFSFDRLEKRYKDDLANDLGNLVNRVLVMLEKYYDGAVPEPRDKDAHGLAAVSDTAWAGVEKALDNYRYDQALEHIWQLLNRMNKLIDAEKPWALAKTDAPALADVLYTLTEGVRQAGWLLTAFLPDTAARILQQVAEPQGQPFDVLKVWGGLDAGRQTARQDATLFPPLA